MICEKCRNGDKKNCKGKKNSTWCDNQSTSPYSGGVPPEVGGYISYTDTSSSSSSSCDTGSSGGGDAGCS